MQTHSSILADAHLHDAGYLLHLTLSWEERVAGVELGKDAAQTPHVDGHTVRVTQDDLWGAVEATLDVGVHCWEKKEAEQESYRNWLFP